MFGIIKKLVKRVEELEAGIRIRDEEQWKESTWNELLKYFGTVTLVKSTEYETIYEIIIVSGTETKIVFRGHKRLIDAFVQGVKIGRKYNK